MADLRLRKDVRGLEGKVEIEHGKNTYEMARSKKEVDSKLKEILMAASD
jgi:hypothetical protein